ncbi:choline kinase [Staphylococcus aureus]|uniref:Choline kinase n=1 Tax=Staphylococcus aureus TaxID=1280 RepID=A0A380E579_STAAU|nr:choline kinase [Staphylococcus aureus]
MEQFYQLGWTLDSAGGASGEAYMAEQDGQKLFLKRNSNPFIAALSAEGIVPKLVWTKTHRNRRGCYSTTLEKWP